MRNGIYEIIDEPFVIKNWNPCLDGTPCKNENICCQIDNGYTCIDGRGPNDICCATKTGKYLRPFTCGKDEICVQHYQNVSSVCQSVGFLRNLKLPSNSS
jgi:hypothetical protein